MAIPTEGGYLVLSIYRVGLRHAWLLLAEVESLELLAARGLHLEQRIEPLRGLAKLANSGKFLQIFGGLVLGCTKTKFCKKICV